MSTLNLSRNWILGERSLLYETTVSLAPGALSDIVDGTMRQLTPKLADLIGQNEVIDFKGRDPHDTLLPGIAAPHSAELVRVGGVCGVAERGQDFEWEPFEVAILSPFKRFEGSHHIVHGVKVERAGALPEWLPVRLIGIAAPIKPRFFRLGLEHFRSLLSFASLGYAPQVRESLLIDCVGDTLALRITTEFKRRGEGNPFETTPHYQMISEIMLNATHFDLKADFERKLASQNV